MDNIFPKTASSQQIQRQYRTLFNYVINSKQPLIILNNNKPEVVIIDLNSYQENQKKLLEYEQLLAQHAIKVYEQEKGQHILKKLSSLSRINYEN